MIDRKCTAAWLDNMGYQKLAKAIMDENRFPDKVIHCKDCKHYKYGMCMKICANKSTNGFCDWGERRTE